MCVGAYISFLVCRSHKVFVNIMEAAVPSCEIATKHLEILYSNDTRADEKEAAASCLKDLEQGVRCICYY